MQKKQGFENLKVWQKAHEFVLSIYKITRNFPKYELFGVTQQLRRSCVSICANIAEGHRKTQKDFLRYLDIAQGSLEETKYYLILSHDLGYYIDIKKFLTQSEEIGKMLTGLSKAVRSNFNL